MPLFSKISKADKSEAPRLILHLETQIAFQQLTMEWYNDGISAGSISLVPSDEMTTRGVYVARDVDAIREFIIPATERKLFVIGLMQTAHIGFLVNPAASRCVDVYDTWSGTLAVILARARVQSACWHEFLANPDDDTIRERLASLDVDEFRSSDGSLRKLNDLVARAGLTGQLTNINLLALNEVRGQLGLQALPPADYALKMMQAISGDRARFFD